MKPQKTRKQQNSFMFEQTRLVRAWFKFLNQLHITWSKKVCLVVIAVILTATSIILPFNEEVSAQSSANNFNSLTPINQAKSLVYYRALRNCIDMGYWKNSVGVVANKDMGSQDANTFAWFAADRPGWRDAEDTARLDTANRTRLGFLGSSTNQGWGDCEDTAWLKDAVINTWGFKSGAQFLCAIGFTREVPVDNCSEPGTSDKNNYVGPENPLKSFADYYGANIGPNIRNDADLSKAARYQLYLNSFKTFCAQTGGSVWKIYEFSAGSTTPNEVGYTYRDRDTNGDTTVYMYNKNPEETGTKRNCNELAKFLGDINGDIVQGYKNWLQDHPATTDTPNNSGEECSINGTCNASSCAIEGIGWLICPLVSFMADIADSSFTFLADNFLQVKTDIVASDSPTFKAWVVIRNVANVAFVIAFLFIIFSQLTGQGVSNYGIKKMLPRLVIAAILVNISFYICQLAVDLSNILGFSLKSALEGISGQVANTAPQAADQTGSWVGITTLILAGTGIAWGLGISVLLPFLLAAVVALLMVFIILIVREMLIILLIVLAPLAFVAFLLPNTEKLFTQWRKIFVALLLIFPIIGLLFGAATLASDILTEAYSGTNNIIGQVVAKAVLVVPLLLLPAILKGSLNAVPALGKLANKLSSKANAGVAGRAREGYKNSLFGRGRAVRKAAKEEFRNRRYAERLTKGGVGGAAARLSARGTTALGIGKEARAQRDSIVSNAEAIVANAEAKEVADAQKVLTQQMGLARAQGGASFNQDAYLREAATGTGAHSGNTEIQRSAAMQQLAAAGRDGVIRDLQTHFRNTGNGTAQANLQRAIQANGGALAGKAPDIVKGAGPAFGNTKGKDLAGFTAGTAEVHMEHLQNLFAAASSPSATPKDHEALDAAVSAFNSAVEDIVSNPSLQAEFGPDVGKKYVESLGKSSAAFQAYAGSNLTGLAGIQPDGKIR